MGNINEKQTKNNLKKTNKAIKKAFTPKKKRRKNNKNKQTNNHQLVHEENDQFLLGEDLTEVDVLIDGEDFLITDSHCPEEFSYIPITDHSYNSEESGQSSSDEYKCIRLMEEPLTWIEAEIQCSNYYHGHLISFPHYSLPIHLFQQHLHSMTETADKTIDGIWIGLSDIYSPNVSNLTNGRNIFEWFSYPGKTLPNKAFTRLIVNNPSYNSLAHHCVAIKYSPVSSSSSSVSLQLTSCSGQYGTRYMSLCEYMDNSNSTQLEQHQAIPSPMITILSNTSISASSLSDHYPFLHRNPCPDGYDYWYGQCYSINHVKKRFYNAQIDCQVNGGQLVTLEDTSIDHWFVEYLIYNGLISEDIPLWIGLHNINIDRELRWINGNPHALIVGKDDTSTNANGYGDEHCVGYRVIDGISSKKYFLCANEFISVCRPQPYGKRILRLISFIHILVFSLLLSKQALSS